MNENEELMAWVLESMRGAALREIAFGDAAIRLEFSKSDAFFGTTFKLKSANFVSVSEHPSDGYESEVLAAMPSLYKSLGAEVLRVSYSDSSATISFVGGERLLIHDKEHIWDNLFSVELENEDGRSECLYGGVKNANKHIAG